MQDTNIENLNMVGNNTDTHLLQQQFKHINYYLYIKNKIIIIYLLECVILFQCFYKAP